MIKYILLLIFTYISATSCREATPPVARKIEHKIETCKGTISDNYYWMRLSDNQKNSANPDEQTSEVLKYLKQENSYAKSVLSSQKEMTKSLFREMKGRISEEESSAPYYENGYYYYTKNVKGKNYPQYFREKDGIKDLYLDANKIAEGKNFCNIYSINISPDNRYLSYCADFVGRNQFTLYIKDLITGKLLEERVPNISYRALWGADSKTIYYVGKDMITLRSDKIYRHTILSDKDDELVYFEDDPTFNITLKKSVDNKYIFIMCDNTLTDEVLYLRSEDSEGQFAIFNEREKGIKYSVDHLNDTFYILTDENGADNNKIMVCNYNKTSANNWKPFISESKESIIRDFHLFENYIVINEEKEANLQLKIVNLKTEESNYIQFSEPCFSAFIDENREVNSHILRYIYTSLSTPITIFEYDMSNNTSTILKKSEVPTYDQTLYSVERIWAKAQDGTPIPISLIYKNDFIKNGKGKVFLYGYGAYGNSSNPAFNSEIISLVDRGFVYAIAHTRGGSEMGRHWYENGKMLMKKNTFTDFNDCARYLIDAKYSSYGNIFAYGASAGGLLIGSIINMEPELYKGVIAGVPFVDVINTMIDETIPLTTFEWDEWGDPRKEPYFSYMLSYSPYDNIQRQDYPNILVTSGFWDSQVQYWEPAKWVAKLREYKTDNNLLLFLCDMESGHGGASGRYNKIMKKATEYSFILML